jgi:hypothetical protein
MEELRRVGLIGSETKDVRDVDMGIKSEKAKN